MSDPIEPILSVPPDRRWRARRREDREARVAAEDRSAAPPPSPSEAEPPLDLRDRMAGFAAFAAQLLGQPGQKRGLRGGPETLEKARAAYLEAEYSGPADRRLNSGRITRTKI